MFEQELFNSIQKDSECKKVFEDRVFSGTAPPNIVQISKPFIVSCGLSKTAIGRNISGKNKSFLHLYQIDIFADEYWQLSIGEKAIHRAIKDGKFDNFTLRVYDDLIPIGTKIWLRLSSDFIVTI